MIKWSKPTGYNYTSGEVLIGNIVVGPRAEFHKHSHAWVLNPIGTIDDVEVFG